mmetsp:Transcript_26098/g.65630  ORF Transcript_26098/g.65630 Transcript_26098/m.65630 type:complete len:291 (-) Transcript_26098:335-1207(-)
MPAPTRRASSSGWRRRWTRGCRLRRCRRSAPCCRRPSRARGLVLAARSYHPPVSVPTMPSATSSGALAITGRDHDLPPRERTRSKTGSSSSTMAVPLSVPMASLRRRAAFCQVGRTVHCESPAQRFGPSCLTRAAGLLSGRQAGLCHHASREGAHRGAAAWPPPKAQLLLQLQAPLLQQLQPQPVLAQRVVLMAQLLVHALQVVHHVHQPLHAVEDLGVALLQVAVVAARAPHGLQQLDQRALCARHQAGHRLQVRRHPLRACAPAGHHLLHTGIHRGDARQQARVGGLQ